MHLSDFETSIIQSINLDTIRNIRDFYHNLCNYVLDKELHANLQKRKTVIPHVKDSILLPLDLDTIEIWNRTRTFLQIIETLHKEELILMVNIGEPKKYSIVSVIDKNGNYSDDMILNSLASEKSNIEILPLPKLRSFIHNHFQTEEEEFNDYQKKYWKKSLRTTIAISLISIFAASFVNYFIYTNEREVTIKNFSDTKDTVYVKAIESINSIISSDTLFNTSNKKELKDSL
ncbi:MAG: hypothetical protein F9K45_02070 [Melioribacteraceae bacterium]|nr:MAG: hypothetical protein F9K45_02070 [Melioribacteraceae bacterium]